MVLLLVISTVGVASYQHPAWIVSWQWGEFLAAFLLVRQLACSPGEQRGLLAALLATGVCLSAQSVVQRALPVPAAHPLQNLDPADWPRLRYEVLAVAEANPLAPWPACAPWGNLCLAAQEEKPGPFRNLPIHHNVALETDEPALPLALRERPQPPPLATFTSADNLAGFLALILPVLGGCILVSWHSRAPRWRTGAVLLCALVVAVALWLTGVRSAIVSCLLVGGAAVVLAWRYAGARRPVLLAGVGLLALLTLALALHPGWGQEVARWQDQCDSAWRLVQDHFWLGVGPGLFGRFFPAYMGPLWPDVPEQAANFALEVAASGGILALLGLMVALVAFFGRVIKHPWKTARPNSQEETGGQTGPAWEFDEGGMAGLVMGFVLRALPLSASDLPTEAVMAVGRTIVWFGAFALLGNLPWLGKTRILAGTAGVTALLLHLSVAGGISVPGVVEPLWIMMALVLNGLPEVPVGWDQSGWAGFFPWPWPGPARCCFICKSSYP